jgi:hypothetical protein
MINEPHLLESKLLLGQSQPAMSCSSVLGTTHTPTKLPVQPVVSLCGPIVIKNKISLSEHLQENVKTISNTCFSEKKEKTQSNSSPKTPLIFSGDANPPMLAAHIFASTLLPQSVRRLLSRARQYPFPRYPPVRATLWERTSVSSAVGQQLRRAGGGGKILRMHEATTSTCSCPSRPSKARWILQRRVLSVGGHQYSKWVASTSLNRTAPTEIWRGPAATASTYPVVLTCVR